MASRFSDIETIARRRLSEITPRFWTSAELVEIIGCGVKDLWRTIVELKQEHFMSFDSNAYLDVGSDQISNIPADIHKIYLIEPQDVSNGGSHSNLFFEPLDFNHPKFRGARAVDPIDPANNIIYYFVSGAGGPVGAVNIKIAPKVTSKVLLLIAYVPTLPAFTSESIVPIPGEVDNALVAWTVAYARAKETEGQVPDAGWLSIYATEKVHILDSLGVRNYQEPKVVDAMFEGYS